VIGRTVRTVAALNSGLRTLFFTTLVFRAGTMAYPFLAAYLLHTPGEPDTGRIGLVVSAFGVGALCADLVAGVVLGRVGARSTMLFGLTVQAAVLVVVPLVRGSAALLPVVLLWGFAYELFTPASYSATLAHATPEERKIAFSCNRLAINVGMGVGPVIGGAAFAVSPTALFSINAVFVLAAAGVLLFGAAVDGRAVRTGQPVKGTDRRRLVSGSPQAETRFWTAFVLSLPIQFAFALPTVFTSLYVIVGLGLPSYWVGVVLGVNAIVIVVCEVPLNTATAGWGHLPTLLVGYGLTGAGFLLMGLATSGPMLVVATLVWTAGEMVVFPGLLTYVSALSEPDMSDRNMSLYAAGVNVAFIAAPQVSFLFSQSRHPALPWFVAGSLVLCALLALTAARTSTYTWLRVTPPIADPARIRRTK
jgi:predicted MFS family arabinose efflux permease